MTTDDYNAAWRELYPFEPHTLRLDAGNMKYVDTGSGRPVVMLHGNPTWSFYFRDLIQAVSDSHRAIAPDHMGCGLSDKPQEYNYSLEQHIDNLETLLVDHLDLHDITLIMHDWGGAIGCGFAVRHPKRVSALVLMNTAAFLVPDCPWRIRACRVPVIGPLVVRGLNGFARSALRMATEHPERFTREVRQGYLAPYDCYANRIALLRFVQDIPLQSGHPTWKTLGDIEKGLHKLEDRPVMVCWGDKDFCFTPRFRNLWQRHFPNADVHAFDDAGHYVLEDAKEYIIPLVTKFMATTGDGN